MLARRELIKKLNKYFQSREDVAFAYLFGSVAKNQAHSESDVDIGVYFKPATRALEYESKNRYPGEDEIWGDLDHLIGREVDMVVLNRAPSTLFSAVLEEGRKVYSADDNLLTRLSEAVTDLAEDFRNFVSDFIKIKGRSKSISLHDEDRLVRVIDFVKDEIADFKKFADINQERYLRDVSLRRNVERWAETLANAAIDIAKILVASRKRPIPRTYKSILEELALLDGFDESIAAKLASFSGMRNVLAHEYLDLQFAMISKFVEEGEPLYNYLIKYAEDAVKNNPKEK